MSNNYEIIKAACIEANPKLLEPTFGCKLIYEDQEVFICDRDKGRIGVVTEWNDRRTDCFILQLEDIEEGLYRILGHPIQLSDVLAAINSSKQILEINSIGGFRIDGKSVALPRYDLFESVQNQDEQTLQFLAELL